MLARDPEPVGLGEQAGGGRRGKGAGHGSDDGPGRLIPRACPGAGPPGARRAGPVPAASGERPGGSGRQRRGAAGGASAGGGGRGSARGGAPAPRGGGGAGGGAGGTAALVGLPGAA